MTSLSFLTKFSIWYYQVISLLATQEWHRLYDTNTYDVIKDGNVHPELNKHLYSTLLNKSKEQPWRLIHNLRQLWSNGVALLHQLRRTYYGELTNVEAICLQGELLGPKWSRRPDETIDNFAARTMDIRRDLSDHELYVDNKIIKQCFIMVLGRDFTEIQKDLQWERLQPECQSLGIFNLVDPARKALCIFNNLRANNQTYKETHKKSSTTNTGDTKTPPDNTQTESNRKRTNRQRRIQQAINNGTFKIEDYTSEVPPKACVFHGTIYDGLQNSSRDCSYIKKTTSGIGRKTISTTHPCSNFSTERLTTASPTSSKNIYSPSP